MEKSSEESYNHTYRIQCQLFGQRYAGACLANLQSFGNDGRDIMGKISSYLKDVQGFMLYIGPPGIGKTYLCSAIVAWLEGKKRQYYYMSEQQFMQKLRESIEKGWDYHRDIENFDHDFLILDDLGSSRTNDWRQEVLFSLINFRYLKKLPTIFTSNIFPASLKDIVGDRGASRLLASENTVIFREKGQDLRQTGH